MRAAALSAVVYFVLTALLGIDVLRQVDLRIASDPGDPLLVGSILTWNATHVPLTDAWWQFPIFHPARDTLAFSEHLLGVSVVAAPLYWLTGSPIATYNLTLLLTYPLCALAMAPGRGPAGERTGQAVGRVAAVPDPDARAMTADVRCQ